MMFIKYEINLRSHRFPDPSMVAITSRPACMLAVELEEIQIAIESETGYQVSNQPISNNCK